MIYFKPQIYEIKGTDLTQTDFLYKPRYKKQYAECFQCSFPRLWLTLLICYCCQINVFFPLFFVVVLGLDPILLFYWFFRHSVEKYYELNLFSYWGGGATEKPWRQQSRINLPFPDKSVGHLPGLKGEMLISSIASLNPEKLLWLL